MVLMEGEALSERLKEKRGAITVLFIPSDFTCIYTSHPLPSISSLLHFVNFYFGAGCTGWSRVEEHMHLDRLCSEHLRSNLSFSVQKILYDYSSTATITIYVRSV